MLVQEKLFLMPVVTSKKEKKVGNEHNDKKTTTARLANATSTPLCGWPHRADRPQAGRMGNAFRLRASTPSPSPWPTVHHCVAVYILSLPFPSGNCVQRHRNILTGLGLKYCGVDGTT
jgi:hypothetical protein